MHKLKKTPKLVINLFRHGARGPLKTEDHYWRGKEGMLTDLGKAQHYVLGASLIQRYPHLKTILKENDERIYLRTTEFTRTKQSLEYHLLGMVEASELPINDLSIYEDSFAKAVKDHKIYEGFMNANRQVVSHLYTRANIVPFEDDLEMLCTELKACPNSFKMLGKEKEEFLESQMRPICEKIYRDTNVRMDGQGLRYFYDYLLANTFEGRSLPEGISPKTWAYIKHAGEYFVVFKRFGSELQRKLFSIFLSNKIIELLKGSKQDAFPHDLVLISAHDVTLFNLLNALNILTPEKMYAKLHENNVEKIYDFPNFASQILIELWQSEDEKHDFVRFIYENKVLNIGEKLEEFYSFSAFENLLKSSYAPYTAEDFFEHSGRENPVKQAKAPKEVVETKVK